MSSHKQKSGHAVRVLIADYATSFGGAPEHAVSLSKYLHLGGHAEVTLLSPQSGLEQRVAPYGVEFLPLSLPQKRLQKINGKGIFGRIAHYAREWAGEEFSLFLQVRAALRKSRSQILQLNNLPSAQRSAILAAKFLGLPCVATHQDFETPSRSLARLLPFVSKHIAISTAVEQHIASLGVPADRIVKIYDAVDTERFHPEVREANLHEVLGLPPSAPTFGIVGRLVPWKGHLMFLDVAAEVLRVMPNARGIIIGDVSDGRATYEHELRQQAEQLGIHEKIIFAGRRENIPGLVKAMDVVLHLSRRPEPLGLVVAEALAVGTPVVGMRDGGVPDMLADGKSGFLCMPQDKDGIVKAVLTLLGDEGLRKSFGRFGTSDIATRFSAQVCAASYSAVYKSLVGGEQ